MIPDNSKKKLEQLRQEAALRAKLSQQYDKEMAGKYTRDMPTFSDWLGQRQQPKKMAKGGVVKRHNFVKHKHGEKVGGYDVGDKINNFGSYASSGIDDIEEGIHRVPMSAFEVTHPNKLFYAKNDIDHVHRLAEQIKQNKYMDPLLVAMDKKGAYVLEGGHRLGAAHLLGMKEIPAMIGHEPEGYANGGKVEPTQDEMRLALTKARRNGMYSPLERLAIDIPRNKGTGAEFMAEISKQKGFKPEEVADRKIPIPEGKMTKLEFLKHLRQHSLPPLQEHMLYDLGSPEAAREDRANDYYNSEYEDLSPEQKIQVKDWVKQNAAKYEEYQIPNGENYREMLLKLPALSPQDSRSINYLQAEKRRTDPEEWAKSNESKRLDALMEKAKKFGPEYNHSHWSDHPNVLAHVRLSDREGPDGEKLLHVEELQSDWHQHGRKVGYARPREEVLKEMREEHERQLAQHEAQIKEKKDSLFNELKSIKNQLREMPIGVSDVGAQLRAREMDIVKEFRALDEMQPPEPPKARDSGVPQAPFKKSWHELGMKHVLHHAAKHGYHGVVITPGEEQAERWRDEGLKVHYDKKIPEFLNKFGKPHGVQLQMHGHRIKGDPFDYGKATEDLGLGHVWMTDLTPEQNQQIAEKADKKLHYFPITEPMRTNILKEGMPQYMRGGVVHKAEGGAVLPIEQMRNELMNKTRFKGLSSLQSIGAEEAPSLGVKAYVPTVGRPDNGQMPVGGIDTQQGDLPVGGIDMSKMQAGQQLMPTPAGQQQGMDQVPQGDKINTMDGTGMPPTPNSNPNQMGSNILSMTPQGQAMAAMKPQGLAKGGKVDVRPTVKDDKATRRTPEIETAVKALAAGIINQKEYDRIVQRYKPVKPYDFVPSPATDEDAMRALNVNQKAKWRGHEEWPAGHPVGLRLDIPSYEKHGVWVNSIHDESGRGKDGFPVSYGPVSAVRNATFEGTPHKAMRVATGEQTKTPFAKIMGELEHIDEKKAVAHMKKFLNHPEYRQIGYDPRRHGDFYDRETMKPVQSSEHVVQIGPLVLAKNPVYGKKRTQYATGGSATTKGYVKSTPKKPHPEVGQRFTATPQGNLVAPKIFDIMKHENKGSIVPVPYDATTRDNRVTEVSGHQLTEPLVTEAGFDYAMDPNHVAQAIGGASNLGIAGRVQDRINQAAKEHEGDVYLAPNTMSEKAENFSHHPAHIVLDLMKQRQLNKKTLKALSDDLRSQPEIHPTTKQKVYPYKNFVGFDHPNLGEQVMKGGFGLETTSGNLRKKMMDRLSLVNIQELLDYNLGDLKASILHPDIASDPKGYMGRTLVKAQAGAPLRLSRHKSYDTDYTGTYAGGFGNRPIETVMPDLFEEVEAELKQRPVKKAKTDTEYRNQVIGALEKRKQRVAQPINARVINNAGLYEEGLKNGEFDPKNLESVLAYYKRKGGYKAGGKVKLHTDQDTMQLALTKKSKKAK